MVRNLRPTLINDFNIDVNKSNISINSALFFNMLSSNGVFSFMDKPTRATGDSSITIDHISTNDNSNIIHRYTFLSEIKNHFSVGCLVVHRKFNSNNNNQKSKTKKYTYAQRRKQI